jgi:hypothetical protein
MRRMMSNGSLVLTAVVVLALSSLALGQATKAEEDQRLNMESHIGQLTGHATAAEGTYRRYCVGCHGR